MIHFISDLHLGPGQPHLTGALIAYLQGPAREAKALYVLGDLFDAWPGDDALADPAAAAIAAAFRDYAAGRTVGFVCGNRDFLVGDAFAAAAGMQRIEEPVELALGDERYVLMHGDALCTDDLPYQQFRAMVRQPAWQQAFLARPLAERLAMASEARARSEDAKQMKSGDIMDVNGEAVAACFRAHGYAHLIHGHTHRPGTHRLTLDGHHCERWVLHDWRDCAQWLEWAPETGLAFRSSACPAC